MTQQTIVRDVWNLRDLLVVWYEETNSMALVHEDSEAIVAEIREEDLRRALEHAHREAAS